MQTSLRYFFSRQFINTDILKKYLILLFCLQNYTQAGEINTL